MDNPWLQLLASLVLLGAGVYVVNREWRMDSRRAAEVEARDETSQRSPNLLPRLVARIIDALPFSIIFTALNFVFELGYVLAVISTITIYAYFVLLDTYTGRTVGKRLLHLRVIGPSGNKPDFRQAALREAWIVVAAIVGAIPFVGQWLATAVWIAIAFTISNSPTKQGKHDQIAGGTRVVRV